jgi:hypothetical protein
MTWAAFNDSGDLPVGIHRAPLHAVVDHFGRGNSQRAILGQRLERIYERALKTGHLYRFIVFGSFVTSKPEPNDIDVFMLMDDAFDVNQVASEATIMFDHMLAQNFEGASIFWLRQMSALGGEQAAVEDWQIKRDKTRRGIVEVIPS